VGGVAEFFPSTRTLKMHRWTEIIRYSAGPIASEGDSLWVATYHNGEGETYPHGILVANSRTEYPTLVRFPDLVHSIARIHGTTLMAGRRSLGLMEGTNIHRWIPVPGPRGDWVLVEVVESR